MSSCTVKLPHERGWRELEIPLSRGEIERLRNQWAEWLAAHPVDSVSGSGTEAGACRSVVGIDEMKISGFDKLVIGIAVAAPRIRFV